MKPLKSFCTIFLFYIVSLATLFSSLSFVIVCLYFAGVPWETLFTICLWIFIVFSAILVPYLLWGAFCATRPYPPSPEKAPLNV
jgi:hypothetical protein